jgi:hypothetical protein
MPGRPKKPVTKENRGGKRTGSGRKSLLALMGCTSADMIKTAEFIAKQESKTIDEVLLEIAYHAESVQHQLAAIKIFKEYTIAKVSEKKVEINKKQAPKVYLPEKKPDPAKVIPIGGRNGKKTAR